jgi:hypothetical protein
MFSFDYFSCLGFSLYDLFLHILVHRVQISLVCVCDMLVNLSAVRFNRMIESCKSCYFNLDNNKV